MGFGTRVKLILDISKAQITPKNPPSLRTLRYASYTWAYFEIKQIEGNLEYQWTKLNIFTRWVASTNQTFLLLFDPKPSVQESILESLSDSTLSESQLRIPFWPYSHVFEIIADLEEAAVWAIRNQVRAIEKETNPDIAQRPNYRRMHDIARHAIHVNENLDVSVQNIETILKHYTLYMRPKRKESYFGAGEDIRNQLEFFRGYIANLRHRSVSNEKRLQNEIQLAFNTVAQASAATSVEIGRAAQIDNSAMKTIAFVTLAFLPPTFISSIFSMSFFQCGDNGWGMSNKFWLYWVVAIPTTIATVMIWQYWHKISPSLHHQPTVIPSPKEHV
ncbi:Mg2+ transporter protein, CorA-like/Zinc transport protein ZntB [Penicillium expansum]|uniref:Mg2+ transporter protein, CorA-like/Zinc transport protein ZntB n=1 Tax=Penicillium expansum TaxID=27334 RepID=A0A0A2K8V3_PENEN|nr:Mg2+ transporter protein, CorA-like/Zinc transport protein ZntB [Penicillium expansum]KGO37604.1 Mg2+ transporter protein, CorA-like/Zinc transport protein ZntB [Penicillium expansum]KGO53717.1 Mg2+ transporter protein, CorA-like/Zinc transport protein ZntB [Penicillium expansum]KGO63306.1 Mg2+ transporter protein, CorA-like/Zinc transport protein ZntB [Penicillium expansum]